MKVVMLTQTYPRFEGDTAGTFIRSIAETLAARGDEVHVLLPWDRAFEGSPDAGGVELHSFKYAPVDAWHLMGYSRTMQADVGLKASAYLLAPAFAMAAWLGLRRLVARVRPDVVNAHWLVPNGIIAALAGACPLVVSLHGSDVFVAERRLFRWLSARALARVDALTGSSPDLVDRATAVHPVARARFIPYGVDPARFDGRHERAATLRRSLGVADAELLILAVGRVVPKKGFDVLVEALARLEPGGWRAVIAGAGHQLEELRARAEALGLGPRLGFPGEVAHDQLPAWYSAADVFVMPSVRDFAGNIDGLPNVVLEAMASERAIVASEVAGIPSVVLQGQTGLLVPERDAERLAEALERLLRRPEERRELGRAARRKVLEELTWDAVAARYRQVYVEAGAAPVKVLIVTNTYPPADISGVGSLAEELLAGLGDDLELEVLTRRAPEAAARVHGTGGPKLLFPLLAALALPRRRGFDLVHVNESDGVMVALGLAFARALGFEAPRLSVTFQVSYRSEARAVRPLRVDGRVVSRPVVSERVFKWLRAPLLALAGRITARLAQAVAACSHYTSHELERDYDIPVQQVVVIPNGLAAGPDPERHCSAADDDAGPVWALYAGRLRTRKAVAVLLEALARPEAASVGLRLAGDGEQLAALKAQARRLGLGERVVFLGRRTRREVEADYRRADIFVLPSIYEGFPVAILEAMAAGLPVVATRVAGVPEAVSQGRSGLLVPPEDAAALAGALGELAADAERRRAMGREARRALLENFSIEWIGAAYRSFWMSLGP